MEDGLSTCAPCPVDLLREIILINHQRSLRHSQVPALSDGLGTLPPKDYSSLDRIMAFSSIGWGSRILFQASRTEDEISPDSSPSLRDWTRVATIYQCAVALYCISTLLQPEQREPDNDHKHAVTFVHCRQILLKDLQATSANEHSHLRKLVLWPLVVLGLTLNHDDILSQSFVLKELEWTSKSLGTASPLVAKTLLEKTWLTGAGGRGGRWECLFDRPYVFCV